MSRDARFFRNPRVAKHFADTHDYEYIGFVKGYVTRFKLTHTRLEAGEFTTKNDGGAYVCVKKEKDNAKSI